jgi:hypothetical protein
MSPEGGIGELSLEARMEAKKADIEFDKRHRHNLLRTIMGTEEGREFVMDLLTRVLLLDRHISADQIGVRNVGIALWSEFNRECPEQLVAAQVEHNDRAEHRVRSRNG